MMVIYRLSPIGLENKKSSSVLAIYTRELLNITDLGVRVRYYKHIISEEVRNAHGSANEGGLATLSGEKIQKARSNQLPN